MKYIVVLILCTLMAYVTARQEVIDRFRRISNECKAETNASNDDIIDLRNRKPPRTARGKCLRACIQKKMGFMNSNGKLVKNEALKIAIDLAEGNTEAIRKSEQVIDACKDLPVPNDHCEAAALYGTCLRSEAVLRGADLPL